MVEFKDGRIVTDLGTLEFISLVMKEWAQYPAEDIEVIVLAVEDWEIEDVWLREEGYQVFDYNPLVYTGIYVNLIKVGEGEWVVSGYSDEEMDEFVDSIQGNLD